MNKSFYQFALSFRGGTKEDENSVFAEAMFKDLSFPKVETEYDPISRYVEEKADSELRSIVFDDLYKIYEERVKQI